MTQLPALTTKAAVLALFSALTFSASSQGQVNPGALRFFGTGSGQQDRARLPLDDNLPGVAGNTPLDVGAGSFTLEFWLRGTLADNPAPGAGGDVTLPGFDWILGHTIVDRDIFGGSQRDFGISLAGGRVRFGTGSGDGPGANGETTIEGSEPVLDGAWHHVACVRDAASGRLGIYVDGRLDYQSAAGLSTADLSYPDAGVPTQQTPWGPYLVLGAEKHDAGPQYPSFAGYFDELHVWNLARTPRQILEQFDRPLSLPQVGLVGLYRFDESAGTALSDSSGAGSPVGLLIANQPGNGQRTFAANDPLETAPLSAGALPFGFQQSLMASGLNEPTCLEFLPDGRLLVGERGGALRLYANGQLEPAPIYQFPVDTSGGERGLFALRRDPNFTQNGHLYALYTDAEPRNRLERVTLGPSGVVPGSGVAIWQANQPAELYHHGGGLDFGPDGYLYLALGDQFDPESSRDLSSQRGKLLRLTVSGAPAPGNPFVGTPGALPEIFARGLRNPFRLGFDPLGGQLWIGDVGGNSPDSWEEVNLGQIGADYGWPVMQGPDCYLPSCAGLAQARHAYQHNDPAYAPGLPQASITLGPTYRYSGPGAFPKAYRDSLYFGDYTNRFIRRAVFDGNQQLVGDPQFLAAPGAGTIVDLEVGPDGALWFVTIGVPWSGNPDLAALWRIAYTGGGNQAPIPVATATPASGPPPLAVQFSAAGSSDPDRGPGPLSFQWDFGDGSGSNQAAPVHTYSNAGPYQATLTVSDGATSAQAAPLAIQVGNPPTVSIAMPAPGSYYQAGQTIAFSGAAQDTEDGVLSPSSLSWSVVLVHLDHVHPFLGPLSGATGGFTIPASGHTPEDTYYEITLTATDSTGLTNSASVAILPRISTLVIDSQPSGLTLQLDGEPIVTPRLVASLVGQQHQLLAPAQASLAGLGYGFDCWSSAAPAQHTLVAPVGGLNLTAKYSAATGSSLEVPVPAPARNADHWPPVGTQLANAFDPLGLCFGQDNGGPYQLAVAFPLFVPQGATILSADVEFIATGDQSGAPTATIRAYDSANLPPFVAGAAQALTAFAPLGSAAVSWNPAAFLPGSLQRTPDLSALVAAVVARPDWSAGAHLGLCFDGTASSLDTWRCVRNQQSGNAPRLRVTYALGGGGGCAALCGFASFGLNAAGANPLGVIASGDPSLGGSILVRVVGLTNAPLAFLQVSLAPAALPLLGGTLHTDPLQQLLLLTAPATTQGALFPLALPSNPAFAGLDLFMAAAAPEPSTPFGLAFSNGLRLRLCP